MYPFVLEVAWRGDEAHPDRFVSGWGRVLLQIFKNKLYR